VILEILADPVVPTTQVGDKAQQLYTQYGMMAIVCLIVAVFVMKVWKMLMKHPVILVIIVLLTLMAIGAIKVVVK
jgi:hypothetical protein